MWFDSRFLRLSHTYVARVKWQRESWAALCTWSSGIQRQYRPVRYCGRPESKPYSTHSWHSSASCFLAFIKCFIYLERSFTRNSALIRHRNLLSPFHGHHRLEWPSCGSRDHLSSLTHKESRGFSLNKEVRWCRRCLIHNAENTSMNPTRRRMLNPDKVYDCPRNWYSHSLTRKKIGWHCIPEHTC